MKYLQNISQLAYDGFREFTEHPVRYSLDALKNYWDVVPAVVLGLSWGNQGDSLFRDYRPFAMVGGCFFGIIPAIIMESSDETRQDRTARDFALYWAGALTSSDMFHQSSLVVETVNKVADILPLAGVWACEHERKRHRLEDITLSSA